MKPSLSDSEKEKPPEFSWSHGALNEFDSHDRLAYNIEYRNVPMGSTSESWMIESFAFGERSTANLIRHDISLASMSPSCTNYR